MPSILPAEKAEKKDQAGWAKRRTCPVAAAATVRGAGGPVDCMRPGVLPRVLVVADDPSVLTRLRDSIPGEWGCSSAGGPAEALASLGAAPADAMLLALRSEAEAFDLARAARLAGPRLVILVFVPSHGSADLARALEAHVDGVVAFPWSPHEIPLAIEAHLEVRRQSGRLKSRRS